MKKLKIGFYNPYLDSLTGGERYTLALASHWSKIHNVDVFWDEAAILKKAAERLRLELDQVQVVPNIFQTGNIFKKLFVSRQYDLIFFLSDGSVPTSLAKHNILHFQVPFQSVDVPFWKLGPYGAIVCNSKFTQYHLDPVLVKKSVVIYPPVKTNVKTSDDKEKLILTVGRFHQWKKQDVLIEAFKKLPTEWRLVCFGGLLPKDTAYFDSLKQKSKGHKVELVPNGSYEKLQSLYRKASIYWHAAGFGETDPQRAEHFGISTVEAMAYGCIPIVYNGGGLVEIIAESSGFLWNNMKELLLMTQKVIQLPNPEEFRKAAKIRSLIFDQNKFIASFDQLLEKII